MASHDSPLSSKQGLLIVLEGRNGAGKSHIISKLMREFTSLGTPVSLYKFPNRQGAYGARIDGYLKKEILISSKYDVLDLFAKNREATRVAICADIAAGRVVICDRYVQSAIAYHIPLHVRDGRAIDMYCDVIGHFDRLMPKPDVVYVIDGHHLNRRGDAREAFHYHSTNANRIHELIRSVAHRTSKSSVVIKNKPDCAAQAVMYIANDIRMRL